MKLEEYLKLESLSQNAFSKLSGIDVATVNRLIHGQIVASRETVHKVAEATDGKVQWYDLMSVAFDKMQGERNEGSTNN